MGESYLNPAERNPLRRVPVGVAGKEPEGWREVTMMNLASKLAGTASGHTDRVATGKIVKREIVPRQAWT